MSIVHENMSKEAFRILQVNCTIRTGGAARIAWTLHEAYRALGHISWMAVGEKDDLDYDVKKIPIKPPDGMIAKGILGLAGYAERKDWRIGGHSMAKTLRRIAEPTRSINRFLGREDFDFQGTQNIFDLFPEMPDIVHLHNLHENYFDLRYLSVLSKRRPTIITLHDTWLLSGHCAYSLDCDKWKSGCGACPYPNLYPSISRDATNFNWKRKRNIFSQSRVFVATPSQWLLNKVEQSILKPSIINSRVIHNGVDLSVFHPVDRLLVRERLGIPKDSIVFLFVAQRGSNNPYKDFDTVWRAIQIIGGENPQKNILLLALGDTNISEVRQDLYYGIKIQFIPYVQDIYELACYYQAADIYLQASRADTFPNVVLEAQACGMPVIATSIGGIPEQIQHGITGWLVPGGDAQAMARIAMSLLDDSNLLRQTGIFAAKNAQKNFGKEQMVKNYLDWYAEIIEAPHGLKSAQ